jgi:hypothetical protein
LCDHCGSEGCGCGGIEGYRTPCQCGTTIGLVSCPECGCNCEPWWSGIEISVDDKEGVIEGFLSDNYLDSHYFPATKEKIIQDLLAYGMQSGSDVYEWTLQSLPQRTFKDVSDFAYALISHLAPIRWNRAQQTDFVSRYKNQKIAFGQRLEVAQDQKAILISADGKKACDTFGAGNYVLARENCPVLAMNSRKMALGFEGQGVLDGFPVFVYPSMEFEIDLMVMGQTKALRKITAKGVARFRISNPNIFLEEIASKGNFNGESSVSVLRKHCEELLKKEMSAHEFDELKNNSQLLENSLSEGVKNVGLGTVKITFSWIGEAGPGMFVGPGAMPPQMIFDPQKIAQLRQMAESMRAAQMTGLGSSQARGPITQQSSPQTSTSVACPSCNFPNQTNNKFCNSCGKPLQPAKKVCPKCGQQFDPSIRFCGNCGTKLP